MTWREAISDCKIQLQKALIDEAALTSTLLAAHVLEVWTRGQVRKFLEVTMSSFERERFQELAGRRLAGEPLQYITGETEFYGLRLFTTPAALIPRPETELLVEHALTHLRARKIRSPRILDIGTGTGAISLAIGSQLKSAHILGIDISEAALELAASNRERTGVKNTEFLLADIFEDVDPLGKFDMVVSNPPYISLSEMQVLQRELLEHEPITAFTDGGDGLSFYRRIAEVAPKLLKERGLLVVEIGFDAAKNVTAIMRERGIKVPQIACDLAGYQRVLIGRLSGSDENAVNQAGSQV
jgi:release factor glutamine methyltransferase